MNTIPKDLYADALLLNVKVLKSGDIIQRDAYADELLHYVHDEASTLTCRVDEKASHHIITGEVETGKE